MRLVEVIPGVDTSDDTVAAARELGEAMGKRVIVAADGPGFLVNRCGRPFYTEALRLLQERVATHEQIDRICRLGGGFRMGPFELMDMVGIDVGFEVAKSFNELSFGEPRWKPNPIQERMARGGRHGRKTRPRLLRLHERRAPAARPRAARAQRRREPRDHDHRERPGGRRPDRARESPPATSCRPRLGEPVEVRALGQPPMLLCADRSLRAFGNPEAVGFHVVAADRGLAARRAHGHAATSRSRRTGTGSASTPSGWRTRPGLVLGRIVTQLVNEAMFAIGEGVGSAEDVDAGLELGLNYPRGAHAWGEAIGLDRVLAALEGLRAERRDERYSPRSRSCAQRSVSSAA